MNFSDIIIKVLREAIDAYIHFKMNRPDWAELISTKEELIQAFRADCESRITLDPVLYIVRKTDVDMSNKLFEHAASTLIADKRHWFPNLAKLTAEQEEVINKENK